MLPGRRKRCHIHFLKSDGTLGFVAPRQISRASSARVSASVARIFSEQLLFSTRCICVRRIFLCLPRVPSATTQARSSKESETNSMDGLTSLSLRAEQRPSASCLQADSSNWRWSSSSAASRSFSAVVNRAHAFSTCPAFSARAGPRKNTQGAEGRRNRDRTTSNEEK